MAKKLSETAKKEAISKEAINIFCRQSGRRWGANSLADHEALTLIESYFEAREKIGRTGLAKEDAKAKKRKKEHNELISEKDVDCFPGEHCD